MDPDAVILPTSKSASAARLGLIPVGNKSSAPTTIDLVENGSDQSDDLDKFSDINS